MTVDKLVESSSDSTHNLSIDTFQFGAEGGWRTLGKIPDVSGDTGTVIVDCPDPGVNEGLCFPLTFRHPGGDELDYKHAYLACLSACSCVFLRCVGVCFTWLLAFGPAYYVLS